MNQRLIHLANTLLEHHMTSGDSKEFLKHARIYIQNAYDQGQADKAAELQKPEHPKVDETAKRPSDADAEAAAAKEQEAAKAQAAAEEAKAAAAKQAAGEKKAKSKDDAKKAAESF